MSRKAYLKHKTPDTNNLLMRRWHFCVTFDATTMIAGKNQAALAVCAQTKVIFPFKLIESWVLDLRDLSLEGVERLCQVDMTWKLVPLYYCPGKEREACIVFVCAQLAVLIFSSSSTSFQTGLFINGNKVMSYLRAWRVWNPLASVQGIASPDCATCLIHLKCYGTFMSPTLLPSSEHFKLVY